MKIKDSLISKIVIFTLLTIVSYFILGNVSESSEKAIGKSSGDWILRAQNPEKYSKGVQISDMKKLVHVPDVDSLELTYDVKMTLNTPWDPGNNHVMKGMTLEEQKEWVSNQKVPRSQDIVIIYTFTPDGWGVEDIAQPGPIYPIGRHQKIFYDFNNQQVVIGVYTPEEMESTHAFGKITYSSFIHAVLAYRTPAELFGVQENLPFYTSNDGYEIQSSRLGHSSTLRLLNKSSENIIFQSESNEDTQQMISAVYYEDPFTIREIELSDYVHEEPLGYSIPMKVIFKRYSNTKLDQRSGENLIESYEYTLVSAKPKQ